MVADYTASTVTLTAPRGLAGLSRALPLRAPALSPFLRQSGVSANLLNPYYQRWNVSLQRELAGGILIDMAYVGSKGTKLFTTEDLNPLGACTIAVLQRPAIRAQFVRPPSLPFLEEEP